MYHGARCWGQGGGQEALVIGSMGSQLDFCVESMPLGSSQKW